MTSENASPTGSVNAALAEFFGTNREAILSDWRELVLGNSATHAARSISTVALTTRLPFIFDDLQASIERYASGAISEEGIRDARSHGFSRWRQGYELSEVMRELKYFRSVLVHQLKNFEEARPDHSSAALLFVSTILHRLLDEMVIDVTEEFLSVQLELKEEIFRRRLEKSSPTE